MGYIVGRNSSPVAADTARNDKSKAGPRCRLFHWPGRGAV